MTSPHSKAEESAALMDAFSTSDSDTLADLLHRRSGYAALDALLTRSEIGLALFDTGLRCTWVNEALEHHVAAGHKWLGQGPDTALPGGAVAMMQRVLATGTPIIGHRYDAPSAGDADPVCTLSFSCLRLDGPDGSTLGVALSVVEDTGGCRAVDRLTLLTEAGAQIGTTLDVMRTGQELADFSVPLLCDFASVDLADTVRLGEEPLARLTADDTYRPVFRRAGLASVLDGVPESLYGVGDVVYAPPSSPLTHVLSHTRSYFEPVLNGSSAWMRLDPRRAETILRHGMHSLMVVPIQARGVFLGVTVFMRSINPAPFDDQELLLAEELVARAALSVDNARLYTQERATALALQRGLLPGTVNGGPAMDVISRCIPADLADSVGGDWYDVIPLSGNRVALVVGDVTGHGIDAAATMGRLRTAVRTLAGLDMPPHQLLAHLDQAVLRLAEDEIGTPDPPMGATCLYAVYDPASRRFTMARAGHPPPAILHPDGSVTIPDLPNGTPLGLGVLPYQTAEMELPHGSTVALYTDGLIESRHHDIDTGIERLRTALGRPCPTLADLCAQVIDTLRTVNSSDDITLLLARTRPDSADEPESPRN
ncbi:SpoIIE family protein phosphatase [Streptomyces nodosus]